MPASFWFSSNTIIYVILLHFLLQLHLRNVYPITSSVILLFFFKCMRARNFTSEGISFSRTNLLNSPLPCQVSCSFLGSQGASATSQAWTLPIVIPARSLPASQVAHSVLCQPGIWGSFLAPSFPSHHIQLVTMKTSRIHLLRIAQITQFSPSSPLSHHSAELLIPTQGSCLLSPVPISIHCPQNDPVEQSSLLTPLPQTYNIDTFKSRIKSQFFRGDI